MILFDVGGTFFDDGKCDPVAGFEGLRACAINPDFVVCRDSGNKKWFAVVMNLHKSKFGLPEDEMIDVVNLKCEPIMTDSLYRYDGIYPAYHINKVNWIAVFLDGSVDDEKLKWLIDISHTLTKKK